MLHITLELLVLETSRRMMKFHGALHDFLPQSFLFVWTVTRQSVHEEAVPLSRSERFDFSENFHHRFTDIELVRGGVGDGDRVVHLRRGGQVLGENEEIPAQHEGSGIKMR